MLPKKGYIIPRARELDFCPSCWNAQSETNPINAKFHGVVVPHYYLFYLERKLIAVFISKELETAGKVILQNFTDKPEYFRRVWKLHRKLGLAAQSLAQKVIGKDLTKSNTRQLLKMALTLKQHWLKFDLVNIYLWFIGADPLKDYLTKKLSRDYEINGQEINDLLLPNELSLAAQEEVASYRITLKSKSGKDTSDDLKTLSREFGWIPFGYDGPVFWDENYYQQKVKALSKKQNQWLKKNIKQVVRQVKMVKLGQQRIIKKHKIDGNLQRLLDIFRKLFVMTDERKRFQFQIHTAYHKVLEQLGVLSGLELRHLKYLDAEEIADMFNKRAFKHHKARAQERVSKPIFVKVRKGKIVKIDAGKKAMKFLEKFTLKASKINEFNGMIASKVDLDRLRGEVRVIMNTNLIPTMKKNEILVTAMTSPDFVPAMRKAKAIITDEGGLTSHAAIVSRELGVTCIIGTKIATQVLKTGDFVEVDATQGVVKILKRAK